MRNLVDVEDGKAVFVIENYRMEIVPLRELSEEIIRESLGTLKAYLFRARLEDKPKIYAMISSLNGELDARKNTQYAKKVVMAFVNQ